MLSPEQFVSDFSQSFLALVSVHLFRAAVPINDSVLRIADNDRVMSQIQKSRLFGKSFFLFLALRDVDTVNAQPAGSWHADNRYRVTGFGEIDFGVNRPNSVFKQRRACRQNPNQEWIAQAKPFQIGK